MRAYKESDFDPDFPAGVGDHGDRAAANFDPDFPAGVGDHGDRAAANFDSPAKAVPAVSAPCDARGSHARNFLLLCGVATACVLVVLVVCN